MWNYSNYPWRPEVASEFAEQHDLLFGVLTLLTVFFTVVVMTIMIALAVYYRKGNKVDRSRPVDEHMVLELTWSVGPLFLALGIFFWSAKLFAGIYNVPADAKEVYIIGKQWMWHMQHANGIRENNELHLPVNEPVKFTMISQDVIHAFYVPEFRLQRQVQPGEYTSFWVQPNKVGRYHIYCNMYCGTQHSEMGGWVYVMSREDYQKWVATGGKKAVASGGVSSPTGGVTLEQRGAALFESNQCSGCHSTTGVKSGKGPTLVGLFGKTREMENGKKIVADNGYLRNVVYFPDEYKLKGWPAGMPSYKGQITEEDLLAINAYIKTLGQPNAGALTPGSAGSTGIGTQNSSIEAVIENPNARAADTDNQQWRFMYGGER